MIKTEKVASVLARQLARQIAEKRLADGASLPSEHVMMNEHGVSRSSLREALRILEHLGLITMKSGTGGGPRVRRPTPTEFGRLATAHFQALGTTMRELVDARLAIEPVIAAEAARDPDPLVVEALCASVSRLDAVANRDDSEYADAASSFHQILVRCGTNPILALFGGALETVFSERVTGLIFPDDARGQVLHDHAAIADAIAAGDADRAEGLTRDHMQDMKRLSYQRYAGVLDQIVDWR